MLRGAVLERVGRIPGVDPQVGLGANPGVAYRPVGARATTVPAPITPALLALTVRCVTAVGDAHVALEASAIFGTVVARFSEDAFAFVVPAAFAAVLRAGLARLRRLAQTVAALAGLAVGRAHIDCVDIRGSLGDVGISNGLYGVHNLDRFYCGRVSQDVDTGHIVNVRYFDDIVLNDIRNFRRSIRRDDRNVSLSIGHRSIRPAIVWHDLRRSIRRNDRNVSLPIGHRSLRPAIVWHDLRVPMRRVRGAACPQANGKDHRQKFLHWWHLLSVR